MDKRDSCQPQTLQRYELKSAKQVIFKNGGTYENVLSCLKVDKVNYATN